MKTRKQFHIFNVESLPNGGKAMRMLSWKNYSMLQAKKVLRRICLRYPSATIYACKSFSYNEGGAA